MKPSEFKEKLGQRATRLSQDIPAVFLALKHKETPFVVKLTAAIALIYALSPIDFIPDFIPVLGYLDDLIILPALVAFTLKHIPSPVLAECREKSAGRWDGGKPKKWYYALPFVAVWLLIIFLIVKCFI